MKSSSLAILLAVLSTVPLYVYAQDENVQKCDAELPIDLAEKAWCLASDILLVQSCISKYGFVRDSLDLDDRWLLTSNDKNPDKDGSCKSTKIVVCKSDGKILNRERGRCSS